MQVGQERAGKRERPGHTNKNDAHGVPDTRILIRIRGDDVRSGLPENSLPGQIARTVIAGHERWSVGKLNRRFNIGLSSHYESLVWRGRQATTNAHTRMSQFPFCDRISQNSDGTSGRTHTDERNWIRPIRMYAIELFVHWPVTATN
jgi:hypothetical protein